MPPIRIEYGLGNYGQGIIIPWRHCLSPLRTRANPFVLMARLDHLWLLLVVVAAGCSFATTLQLRMPAASRGWSKHNLRAQFKHKMHPRSLRRCATSALRELSTIAIFTPLIQLVVLTIFCSFGCCYFGGIEVPGNGMLDALKFLKHALRAPDDLETRLVHCFRVNPC